eukprot:GHRQ01020367.1.p1 GENE.GHRQ01020367.1~~GHRQ01020367.1.p1  ORF type:complete len:265 (-),score=35.97 GHRQ01020367.1:103-897(-)
MQHSNANIRVMACDLSCLASVRQFAANYKASGKPCHILINNAGVMACPYTLSAEKHEMQFATNHLGHFLLTTELLPVLISTAKQAGSHSRVVVLSSSAHFNPYKKQAGGPIRFDAIDSPEGYDVWGAYVSCSRSAIPLQLVGTCSCPCAGGIQRSGVQMLMACVLGARFAVHGCAATASLHQHVAYCSPFWRPSHACICMYGVCRCMPFVCQLTLHACFQAEQYAECLPLVQHCCCCALHTMWFPCRARASYATCCLRVSCTRG